MHFPFLLRAKQKPWQRFGHCSPPVLRSTRRRSAQWRPTLLYALQVGFLPFLLIVSLRLFMISASWLPAKCGPQGGEALEEEIKAAEAQAAELSS
ncbi:hypothetical protein B296_00029080 [Ensete ventricosum]|uniref:Transmembrane protein n=1 Tax=Ensete ventricosum TaxID=4639 RepID=A0A426YTQ1_ENSVE|nr:hypothetical protein B296_00029080 [Ensete ventricosum]